MLTVPLAVNTICNSSETHTKSEGDTLPQTVTEESTTEAEKETISVLKLSSGKTESLDMNEYITGVVAGEMPASFSTEALKAQAVASYTYAKHIQETTNGDNTVAITDSPSVHQCYISKKEQKEKWGDDYEQYRKKIEAAVKSVQGEMLTYEGKTAMTVFHAGGSGSTNSAADIWGSEVPYLISVSAPTEEKIRQSYSFTAKEFKTLFEEYGCDFDDGQDPKKWASITDKTESGYIKELTVGNKEFSAEEVSAILELPSLSFTATLENTTFVFSASGKGHGVGLSQLSAEYMALSGCSYKEILAHFYPGTVLVSK